MFLSVKWYILTFDYFISIIIEQEATHKKHKVHGYLIAQMKGFWRLLILTHTTVVIKADIYLSKIDIKM